MQKLAEITGAIADKNDGALVRRALQGLYDRMSSQIFASAGIAQATTTTKVKIGSPVVGIAGGVPVSLATASGDNLWTLSGVVADGKTNVFCLYLDAAGTATTAMGAEATTVVAGTLNNSIKFPPLPEKKIMVGFVVVSCSGGAFTGGTSNIATAGNFTVTFVNTVGMFDPTATI